LPENKPLIKLMICALHFTLRWYLRVEPHVKFEQALFAFTHVEDVYINWTVCEYWL